MEKKVKTVIVVLVVLLLCVMLIVVSQWPVIIAEFKIGNPLEHPDYAGTLTIPSVGIDVPMIAVEDPDMMQIVVDKANCAALIKVISGLVNGQENGVSWLIGDHSFQEFDTLHQVSIGDKAKIVCPDGTVIELVIASSFKGYNINGDLVYEDGTSVRKDNPNGFILYTCADETAIPVHIVFLQPAGGEKNSPPAL